MFDSVRTYFAFNRDFFPWQRDILLSLPIWVAQKPGLFFNETKKYWRANARIFESNILMSEHDGEKKTKEERKNVHRQLGFNESSS